MRRSTNGHYEVSGPGSEGRSVPSLGAAISFAMTLAGKLDAPTGTWYVRGAEGATVAFVERHDDRSVSIQRGAPVTARAEAAPTVALSEAAGS